MYVISIWGHSGFLLWGIVLYRKQPVEVSHFLHACISAVQFPDAKISRRRSPTAVGFKQWSNFATQDGLMMAGTGFHSLSLFGDFLPALPRPLLDQRQDETCSLRKRA